MASPYCIPKGLVAVIGGTGMNDWPGLEVLGSAEVNTAYGPPSAPLLHGRLAGVEVLFLPRHGVGHKLPPHAINYRANIQALADAGVKAVVAIAAVGSMAQAFAPGEVALPEDLIDYSWGRAHSYSDGSGELQHVEFSPAYHPGLRAKLLAAAERTGVLAASAPVMAVTQGPRLETAAEIQKLMRDGCQMVGMTSMPEAALAAELQLPYACLAVSVNWAAGLSSAGIHDEISASIAAGMAKVQAILAAALPTL